MLYWSAGAARMARSWLTLVDVRADARTPADQCGPRLQTTRPSWLRLREALTSTSSSFNSNLSSSYSAYELMSILRSSVVRLAENDPSNACELSRLSPSSSAPARMLNTHRFHGSVSAETCCRICSGAS